MVMSRSGFSYSAAYTALPRRAAWLDKVTFRTMVIVKSAPSLGSDAACEQSCLHLKRTASKPAQRADRPVRGT